MRAPEVRTRTGPGLRLGLLGRRRRLAVAPVAAPRSPDVGGAPGALIARPRLLERRRREDLGARGWGPPARPRARDPRAQLSRGPHLVRGSWPRAVGVVTASPAAAAASGLAAT